VNNVRAKTGNFEKDIVVQGVKFSSIVDNMNSSDASQSADLMNEVESLKEDIKRYKSHKTPQMIYYSKQNPEDLHEEIRKDMRANGGEYIPKSIRGMDTISAENVEVQNVNVRADTINNIKFNGVPLSDALDKRYAKQADVTNVLKESSAKRTISQISVNSVTNELELTYSDSSIPKTRVKLPESRAGIKSANIEADKLVLTYTSGVRSKIPLPKVDTSNLVSKETLERDYAKQKNNDASILYLDERQKEKLESIINNDTTEQINNNGATSEIIYQIKNKVDKTGADLETLREKTMKYDLMESRFKSGISLEEINRHSRTNNSEDFLRLNENVALRAKGNRLQMCTNLKNLNPNDVNYDDVKNCHDFWTSKDFGEDDEIRISKI
jgi:hypothetical protein